MDMQHNEKLFFIYDKLMTKEEQQKADINLNFVAFGIMNGIIKRVTTRRDPLMKIMMKRIFAVPQNGTSLLFGGIFSLANYERDIYKLHTYYHNSILVLGETIKEDLFDSIESGIRPIKFHSLEDIKTCNYEIGNEIVCSTFIGNQANKRIRHNTKMSEYSMPSMDKSSYIQMIKERQNEVKE